jgi:hypothetical protein
MQTNTGNPIGGVFLLALIVLMILAVVGAKESKWKLLNLLIIVGFMGLGLLAGFLIGGNTAIGGHVSAALMTPVGAVGAFVCIRRNKIRAKKELVS